MRTSETLIPVNGRGSPSFREAFPGRGISVLCFLQFRDVWREVPCRSQEKSKLARAEGTGMGREAE